MLEETGARGHEERVLVGGEAGGPGSEPIEGKKERGYKGGTVRNSVPGSWMQGKGRNISQDEANWISIEDREL